LIVSETPVLAAVESELADHFGHRPQRASVSFVGVDPVEVLRFEPIPDERAYVSLGMSGRPMTGADEAMVDSAGPRAVLMLHLRDPADEHADVWRRLAVLAAGPAVEGVVYRAGMSVELGEPLTPDSGCVGVILAESALSAIDSPAGPVTVLQVLPATSTELAWCRVRGSAALTERWREHGTDLLDLTRRAVALD
jgi:hypothetical protein